MKLYDISSPNYQCLLASYQSALTKWEKSSGILAHYETAAAAMKEMAKAKARAAAKQDGGGGKEPRRIDGDRFDV